jgi:dihydrolipoamide dehydrogenase
MVVGELAEETDLLIIGAGPGGYVAAFRAADLGLQTTLVDTSPLLGGVCLREGCIPSKALLHVAHLIDSAAEAKNFGVEFAPPKIDVPRLRGWKQSVVEKLCGGINTLAKKRNVRVLQGRARFEDSRTARVDGEGMTRLKFKHAIIASGSRPKSLPEKILPADCAIDSSGALDIQSIPPKLLVIGGGYIGIELGQVYANLGSQVTVIEMLDRILTGCDDDLARPLVARLKKQFQAIYTGASLKSAPEERRPDRGVVQSRRPGPDAHVRPRARVCRPPAQLGQSRPREHESGRQRPRFIEVDEARRTGDKRIYAIGDVAGNPMLAHKASREGIVAAEAIAGPPSVFDARAIPAVVYTSPEVAWCGLTETEAKERGVEVKVGKFTWGASGRAIAMGRPEGLTKVIADAQSGRVLGVGVVGEHAGDLIAEAVLAIEMGAAAEDLALTIHPHPSTSETVMEAAESVLGTAIHMLRK